MSEMTFGDLLLQKDGLIKGPFGGDIKKSLFVPKTDDTYKVYEQGLVLNRDINRGDYYVSKEYFEKKLKRFEVKENDILLTGAGTLGELFIVPPNAPKGIINQALLRVRLNKEVVDQNFFCYYFKYYVKSIISNINGDSVIPNLPPLPIIKSTVIDIPDISYQQKIAAVLTAMDAKIELNARINAELESMAKTLYDYWFVQFAPHKSAGGKMVWSEELKREIPLGWEVCELGKYVTSKRGVSYRGKDIVGDGVPMINLNSFNMATGTYKPEGIKTYSGDYGENKILKPFDLVMCNTQQTALDPKKDIIGKSFLIPDIFNSDIVSSHHVTAITVEKENLKYYLNSLFNTEYFHRYISGYATGTNILGLNFEGVLSFKTAIPNDDLLDRYKAIVVNVEKQKARIIKESQTLTELRDWLLPMLMNGQASIKN